MKKTALLLALLMLIVGTNVNVFASSSEVCEVDEFLLATGMQRAVIDSLPEFQRRDIFNELRSFCLEDVSFESLTVQTFNLPECEHGEMYMTSEFSINANDMFVPLSGQIPAADLTLLVNVFVISVVNNTYMVFPGFWWNSAGTSIRNDGFAFAMYPGWVVEPGHPNPSLRLTGRCAWTGAVETFNWHPNEMTPSGYGFRGFSVNNNSALRMMQFDGSTSVLVRRYNPHAVRGIMISYVNDTNRIFSTSFSFSIGPFGISVVSSSQGNLATRHARLAF